MSRQEVDPLGSQSFDDRQVPGVLNFNLGRKNRFFLGLGAFVTSAAILASPVYNYFDHTGDVEIHCPDSGIPEVSTGLPNFATLNVHKRFMPSEIAKIIKENNLVAIGLQEVPANDVPGYISALPEMCIVSIVADSKDLPEGGQTNMIVSSVKPSSYDSAVLGKSGFWQAAREIARGFISDTRSNFENIATAKPSFGIDEVRDSIPENRVIISTTFEQEVEDDIEGLGVIGSGLGSHIQPKTETIKYVSSHLTFRPEEKPDQHSRAREFVLKGKADNRIMCADWNSGSIAVRNLLSRDGFITLSDGPTSDSGSAIDHCSVKWKGIFTSMRVKVVKQPLTDHDAVIVEINPFNLNP